MLRSPELVLDDFVEGSRSRVLSSLERESTEKPKIHLMVPILTTAPITLSLVQTDSLCCPVVGEQNGERHGLRGRAGFEFWL